MLRCRRCHVAWMAEGELAYYSRVTAGDPIMMSVSLVHTRHAREHHVLGQAKHLELRGLRATVKFGPGKERPV
jgi:hypothetical protein